MRGSSQVMEFFWFVDVDILYNPQRYFLRQTLS